MAIGIVGLGRLGGALARGLTRAGVQDVHGFSRTPGRAREVADQAPALRLLNSAAAVLETCDPVFVWMAPPDAIEVLRANPEVLERRNPMIVTCAPGSGVADLVSRWVDTLPNVNLSTGQGATLLSWGWEASDGERESVLAPLRACGEVYEVAAEDLAYHAALTSNGPAFYARLMETWADVLADRLGYDRELCRRMVRQTMVGTVTLQDQDGIDAAEVIRRVAHPGASTEKGLKVLDEHLRPVAEQVLRAMW